MKKNILYKEEQLNRGIPEYRSGQKRFFTGFCESRSFRETANNGSFQKKGLDMTYAGIINLKKLKKATTTLKYTDVESLL